MFNRTAMVDVYKRQVEALQHGGIAHRARVRVKWRQADDLAGPETDVDAAFAGAQGILVPGGFGNRGIEGKMIAARYAREHGVPYLGICLGLSLIHIWPFANPPLAARTARRLSS